MLREDQIVHNPDGWGPTDEPAALVNVPFAPYSKSEKLGRAADWGSTSQQHKYYGRNINVNAPSVFTFQEDQEEGTFEMVDTGKVIVKKPQYGSNRQTRHQHQQRTQQQQQHNQRGNTRQQKRPTYNRDQRTTQYSSSVDVRPDWEVIKTINFLALHKQSMDVGPGEVLARCGELDFYDRNIDKVTPKSCVTLKKTGRVFRSVTTSDDPIMRQLAGDDAGQIFITDSLLSTLMCMVRSVYSFDVVVTVVNGKVFFDKREGRNVDLLTVNETSPDPVQEDAKSINGVQKLSIEATRVNQNFSQQALKNTSAKYKLDQPNPFVDQQSQAQLASVGYIYKRFKTPDGPSVIVRCEVDGVMKYQEKEVFVLIKALNEYIAGATSQWRQVLETQKQAVWAMQVKSNTNRIAKTVTQALLAEAELLKVGFISRNNPRDAHNHVVLATHQVKPKDVAALINLPLSTGWGVFMFLVAMLQQQIDGKYLLLREPGNPNQYQRDAAKELLRLYRVPDRAFEAVQVVDEDVTEEAGVAPLGIHAQPGDE